jgi:hypothetical protein
MAFPSYVKPLLMETFASSGMTSSYQAITPASGLPNSCFLFKIINDSSADVTVSYNGTNAHDYIPTMTAVVYDLQANASPQNLRAWLAAGTNIYLTGTAGTGNIYLTGWYQPSVV